MAYHLTQQPAASNNFSTEMDFMEITSISQKSDRQTQTLELI